MYTYCQAVAPSSSIYGVNSRSSILNIFEMLNFELLKKLSGFSFDLFKFVRSYDGAIERIQMS